MATKKYLSYDGLTEYDALIKAYAEATVSNKQDKLTGVEGQVVGFDENGNVTAKDAVQSNWNQNDENAADYVKNRPFYTTDPSETLLLEETSIDFLSNDPLNNPFTLSEIIEGKTYNVIWDNTLYECVSYIAPEVEAPSIGNGAIIGLPGDGSEPFFITIFNGNVMVFASEVGTHTISISTISPEIVKIPSKYLSNSNIINGEGTSSLKTISATEASGAYSFAEGCRTTASGHNSHAEGEGTIASGYNSHAEGGNTTAFGIKSHAEGSSSIAHGENSHAEGSETLAFGKNSHSEGYGTYSLLKLTGEANTIIYSVSNLNSSVKSGCILKHNNTYALIESINKSAATITLDKTLSTESLNDIYVYCYYGGVAYGNYSHAEGDRTIALSESQHVQGKFNVIDNADTYAHIVGNGDNSIYRSNAHTVDWEGNAWFAGDVYVGSTSGTNKDAGSVKLQREIKGVEGQVVGFDANGNAAAVNATAVNATVNTSITIPAGRLVGDINGDGVIDSTDFNFLMGATGSAGIKYYGTNFENAFTSKGLEVPIDYLAADTSTSGDINMLDMNALLDINAFYPTSYDLLNNWSKVEGTTSNTEYPFYVDIQSEYADGKHDFIIIADNACPYISSQAQIVSGSIRIFAKWLPVNDVNANVIVSNGNGSANIVVAPNAVTETINASISNVDTGSVFTQLVKPADVPFSCTINIEDMFFQANGYTYLLYLIDAASENTYKKYVSKTTLSANALKIDFSDIPDSNIKMHFTRINVGSGTSRIAPIYMDAQPKITGNAGDFVVIGADGNVTTKTVPSAEEASF